MASKARRNKTLGLMALFLGLTFASLVIGLAEGYAYDPGIAHPWITEKAVQLLREYRFFVKNSYLPPNYLREIINNNYISDFKKGAEEEDPPEAEFLINPFARSWFHFMRPLGNLDGIWQMVRLVRVANSYEWATIPIIIHRPGYEDEQNQYKWSDAKYAYLTDRHYSYEVLGHICHLLQDLSVPAHTQLDPHVPGDDLEDYVKEKWWKIRPLDVFSEGPIEPQLKDQPSEPMGLAWLFGNMAKLSYYRNRYPGTKLLEMYPDISLIDYPWSIPGVGSYYYHLDIRDNLSLSNWWETAKFDQNTAETPDYYYIENISDRPPAGDWGNWGDVDPTILSPSMDWRQLSWEPTNGQLLTERYANDLVPLAIRYTAGLLKHFYDTMHPAPTIRKVVPVGSSIEVVWDAPDSGVCPSSYKIYRSTTSGRGYSLLEDVKLERHYTDGNVTQNVDYYYVVTALDNSGEESNYSCEVRGRISTSEMPVLTLAPENIELGTILWPGSLNVEIVLGNTGGGTLNWTASRYNTGDWLQLAPSSGSTTAEADTVNATINTSDLSPGDLLAGAVKIDGGVGGTRFVLLRGKVGGNQIPNLRSGAVNPTRGEISTVFVFFVDYEDGDNDPPVLRKLVIDGKEYSLGTTDTNYADYSLFTKQLSGLQLGLGLHNFYFEFEEGNGGADRYPSSGDLQVEVLASPPSMYVYDPDGIGDYVAKASQNPFYTIRWTALDPAQNPLSISLYYSSSINQQEMIEIAGGLENTGTYSWDITNIPNGSYYIYGVSDNGTGQTEDDWSTGQVTLGDSIPTNPQETWYPMIPLPAKCLSSGGNYPSIAVGPNNDVHAVWSDNGQVFYRQSRDGGLNWNPVQQVSSSESAAQQTELAVDSRGNVHIAWLYREILPQIYYKKLDNQGNVLIGERNISQSSAATSDPKLALDGNQNVHVIWTDMRNSRDDLYYSRSADIGSTWQPPAMLVSRGDAYAYPHAITFSGSSGYIVLTDYTNWKLSLLKTSNAGVSWSSPAHFSSGVERPKYPDLKSLGNELYLVYRVPDGIMFRGSYDGGNTWMNPTKIACFPTDGIYPKIAVNIQGLYVARLGGYFAESFDKGQNWSTELALSFPSSTHTRLALDSEGNIHVISGVCYRRTGSPEESISTPERPSGISTAYVGQTLIFSSGKAVSVFGDPLEYMFDWKGDGSDLSGWGEATRANIYVSAGTYTVRVKARCSIHTTAESSWSEALVVEVGAVEKVSSPSISSGPQIGRVGQSLVFETNGSISSLGHSMEYMFFWGDKTASPWSSSLRASHSYAAPSNYEVRIQARCASDVNTTSGLSEIFSVEIVSSPAVTGDMNADGAVDLVDAIIALRVLAGQSLPFAVGKGADMNGDWKIGSEEVIYILQKLAGQRQ